MAGPIKDMYHDKHWWILASCCWQGGLGLHRKGPYVLTKKERDHRERNLLAYFYRRSWVTWTPLLGIEPDRWEFFVLTNFWFREECQMLVNTLELKLMHSYTYKQSPLQISLELSDFTSSRYRCIERVYRLIYVHRSLINAQSTSEKNLLMHGAITIFGWTLSTAVWSMCICLVINQPKSWRHRVRAEPQSFHIVWVEGRKLSNCCNQGHVGGLCRASFMECMCSIS
jgi:hypothetical protein